MRFPRTDHLKRFEIEPQVGRRPPDFEPAVPRFGIGGLLGHHQIERRGDDPLRMNMRGVIIAGTRAAAGQPHRPRAEQPPRCIAVAQQRVSVVARGQLVAVGLERCADRLMQLGQHRFGAVEQDAARLGAAAQGLAKRHGGARVQAAQFGNRLGHQPLAPDQRAQLDEAGLVVEPFGARIIRQPPSHAAQRPSGNVPRIGGKRTLEQVLRRSGIALAQGVAGLVQEA